MSKESLYSQDKSLVFKETFNSPYDVKRNGGVIFSTIEFINSIGVFFPGSYINYSSKYLDTTPYNKTYRFNLKFYENILTSTQTLMGGANSNNYLLGYIYNSGSTIALVWGSLLILDPPFLPNLWYEIVIVTTNTGTSLYVNGKHIGTDDPPHHSISPKGIYKIGGLSGAYKFNGEMRLVEQYNRAFTPQEVALLYSKKLYVKPNPLDYGLEEVFNLDLTNKSVVPTIDSLGNEIINNGVEIKKLGAVNGGLFINNSLSTNSVFNKIDGKSYTIIAWCRMNEVNSQGRNQVINIFGSIGGTYFRLGYRGSTIQLMRFLHLTPNGSVTSTLNSNVRLNKWYCYVVTYDGTTLKGFTNGQSAFTTIVTLSSISPINSLYIGAEGVTTDAWLGHISQVKIYGNAPSDPAKFAAQYYNSQKHLYNL